ncbi:MAG: hypothetical protein WD294_10590 [Phycisphaeraceae bacterium]
MPADATDNPVHALGNVIANIRPVDRRTLAGWLRAVLGISVPAQGVCPGHSSPLDYLEHVFFEHPEDVIVWANRGGGKTFYGAVATLLDLLFKPGIQVRILGGSLEQSRKMYDYLRWMLERESLRHLIDGRMTEKGVRLQNGSGVELLAQSERSVRGHRVQKLRCDEVELFDRDVWSAAQFVTRSATCGGIKVNGTVEVMSTMHRPFGLMSELVDEANQTQSWRVIRWCALDVMDRCEPERSCETCTLWETCQGEAKNWRGYLAVEDVLSQRRRSSAAAFESEMLCRRPTRSDSVYPMFEPDVHVKPITPDPRLTWIGGMDFGLRSPFVMLWAQLRPTPDGSHQLEIIDEYIQADRSMEDHLAAMAAKKWPQVQWVGVDPAGHQRSLHTGQSTVALLREARFRVRARRMRLHDGLESVRRMLENAEPCHPADHATSPLPQRETGAVIDPRCQRLIEALTCYHFDADRPWRDEPVKDGYDHAADALRYMVINLAAGSSTRIVAY